MCKIKDGYKLELQMPETIKLFDSTKKIIDNTNNNGENVSGLEVTEVVLVFMQCNLIDSQYQQKSKIIS